MADENPSVNSFRPESDGRPSRIRFAVILLVALASSSAYLTRYCVAQSTTTIREDMGLTNTQMGVIFSAFAWGYLFCQVPGGWLGERIGTRAALPLISILWSLFTVWTAAAGAYASFVASRVAFGMAQGGLTPLSAQIIKDWIPLKQRGLNSALIGAAMSLGAMVTMYLTAVLLDDYGWHWRNVFRVYSVVGIIWAAGFYLFFRTQPEQHPLVNRAELGLIRSSESREEGVSAASGASAPEEESTATAIDLFAKMLVSRSMWGLCLQSFFRAAGYFFFVTWFPAFLEDAYDLTRAEVGKYTSLPLASVMCGTIGGGFMTDSLLRQTGSKWISRSGVAFVALALCGFFTLAAAWTTSAEGLVTLMACGAALSGLANPPAWAATIEVAGKQTAVPFGTMNMAGCLAGMSVPIYVGRMFDQIKATDGDWNVIISLHAAFYFAAALSWLLVDPNTSLSDRSQK